MTTLPHVYLTIKDKRLWVYANVDGGERRRMVRDIEDLNRYLDALAREAGLTSLAGFRIVGSSTLDFAEEYTDDETVLDMVRRINAE